MLNSLFLDEVIINWIVEEVNYVFFFNWEVMYDFEDLIKVAIGEYIFDLLIC